MAGNSASHRIELRAVALDERVRLNLWLFNGAAPTDGLPVEVVVESFVFTP